MGSVPGDHRESSLPTRMPSPRRYQRVVAQRDPPTGRDQLSRGCAQRRQAHRPAASPHVANGPARQALAGASALSGGQSRVSHCASAPRISGTLTCICTAYPRFGSGGSGTDSAAGSRRESRRTTRGLTQMRVSGPQSQSGASCGATCQGVRTAGGNDGAGSGGGGLSRRCTVSSTKAKRQPLPSSSRR